MSLTTAVIHDVKNRLAELAMRLTERDPQGAALALAASAKLAQLLVSEGGPLVARIDAAAPADLLDELAAEYRDLYPDKVIQADTAACPMLWFYDVGLLRLALANAVHNALRHCRSRVQLRGYEQDGELILAVADDGEGFPASVLAGETGSQVGSTGLGLAISRRIAGAHRLKAQSGRVELLNDNGACFRLILP